MIEYDMVPMCPVRPLPRLVARPRRPPSEWMIDSNGCTRRRGEREKDGADARVEAFSVFSGCSSRVRETERLAKAIDREIARAR